MRIVRMKLYFISFQDFIFHCHQTIDRQSLSSCQKKNEKCTSLLEILIFELNQMNSDNAIDGRFGFAV